MSSQCFPFHNGFITNMSRHPQIPSVPSNLALPIMTFFSPSIAFKVNKSLQKNSCMVAEVVSSNGWPLEIQSIYKSIFMRELQCICNSKLTEIDATYKGFQSILQKSTEQFNFMVKQDKSYSSLRLVFDNNQIRIQFFQIESMTEQNGSNDDKIAQIFLYFLRQINNPLISLFQRIGTLKPSFSEKLKSNRQIQLSKKIIQKIIRNKRQEHVEIMNEEHDLSSETNSIGVFEERSVVSQEKMDENEMIFKRGGYFNIVKRKLVVCKSNNQFQNLQCKLFAQKKLSRRKRPNTIYNYEGKIPKELKLLECLNKISLNELKHFTKYYILNVASLASSSQLQQMIDESQWDEKQKGTLSTASQNVTQTSLTDVIYMDYYEENLEEYLIRKGKLDIFEILCLLRQILQSVLTLHKVGIVHRDIKPANFMIETLENGTIKTKLIDFGESAHVSSKYEDSQILGFSTQYAPIECTYPCKQGFNSKQIDLWSVGVVIYRLTTGRMPVTYSKCFKSDIKYEWPTSLSFFINQSGLGRWSIVENMLVSLSLMFMRVKSETRLSLKQGLAVLERIQKMAQYFSNQQSFTNSQI